MWRLKYHKILISVLLTLLCFPKQSFATHNRAGEITFKRLNEFTYEVTIITYTNRKQPSTGQPLADRNELKLNWGDNTSSDIPRIQFIDLPDYYRWNKYVGVHTYPGPGAYEIVMSDPTRNEDVTNIPNPLETLFTIETTLIINSSLGYNNSPQLLYPPTDKAILNQTFIHNPAAYDPDGDSLSYKLTESRGLNGEPIPGYIYPPYTKSLYVNEVTGDLVWDAPKNLGTYNVAMEITEWRNGIAISRILRDIQIKVEESPNLPPVNQNLAEICVVAGDTIRVDITSSDPDLNNIAHFAYGSPLEVINPATFTPINTNSSSITSQFEWITTCDNIFSRPYQLLIKAEEISTDPKLFDLDNYLFSVIGPQPLNPQITAGISAFYISWEAPVCGNVSGYEIYRKAGSDDFSDYDCLRGIPLNSGYKKIYSSNNTSELTYSDSYVKRGVEYCYRIVPIYGDFNPGPGKASEPICATLPPGTPAFIKTSVDSVGLNGNILLQWGKPMDVIDSIVGPFELNLFRQNPGDDSFNMIKAWTSVDLNDTTYLDSLINTEIYPYTYMLQIFYDNNGKEMIGFPDTTSSTYIEFIPNDNQLELNIIDNVPWIDTMFIIQRLNETSLEFDSIGYTYTNSFIDTGLVNRHEYNYRVKSKGWRVIDSTLFYTSNLSHIVTGIPEDKTPPCPPSLSVATFCNEFYNELEWSNPNNICSDDVVKYNIYYQNEMNSSLSLIDSVKGNTTTRYEHTPQISLGACYGVTATDTFNNESDMSNIVCIDSCTYYVLPNVLSPNNDGEYDIFTAENRNNAIKEVEMKIFNRWGSLVFETTDPAINWDGKNQTTNILCKTGVYYYICTIYEQRITGNEPRTLTGFIYLLAHQKKVKTNE